MQRRAYSLVFDAWLDCHAAAVIARNDGNNMESAVLISAAQDLSAILMRDRKQFDEVLKEKAAA